MDALPTSYIAEACSESHERSETGHRGWRSRRLSAGCYARINEFDVTIVEHNLSLGGVCTAWHRGAYLVDGCIHWLTGGPFMEIICAALGRQFRLAPSAIGV